MEVYKVQNFFCELVNQCKVDFIYKYNQFLSFERENLKSQGGNKMQNCKRRVTLCQKKNTVAANLLIYFHIIPYLCNSNSV